MMWGQTFPGRILIHFVETIRLKYTKEDDSSSFPPLHFVEEWWYKMIHSWFLSFETIKTEFDWFNHERCLIGFSCFLYQTDCQPLHKKKKERKIWLTPYLFLSKYIQENLVQSLRNVTGHLDLKIFGMMDGPPLSLWIRKEGEED